MQTGLSFPLTTLLSTGPSESYRSGFSEDVSIKLRQFVYYYYYYLIFLRE